jgi:hypothetical protein
MQWYTTLIRTLAIVKMLHNCFDPFMAYLFYSNILHTKSFPSIRCLKFVTRDLNFQIYFITQIQNQVFDL